MSRRIPRVKRPDRYSMDALPGLEAHGAQPRSWSPEVPSDPAHQGWLPFTDGAQMGPLFDLPEEADG